ncbi:hypothetical protein IMG5_091269 [Ichthyophthirius multifiliis]|uniref:Protein kinase domain-containing protein n=1 Tax=Ichthyophthirius multifiliis TaxID=5932 RepID=G0QRB7_ICHMU|nr:hypothetical protein IMG5_091269 [Ichthyophthirius multifiliis]EGR32236.1 hypothetical protein IMG5_091269 [Ichthyophthirius multifiliis]|eukprot:XP_004035722.1 hypothetical protein IMG5_091269 [Ichthyophthirius multifiliis]
MNLITQKYKKNLQINKNNLLICDFFNIKGKNDTKIYYLELYNDNIYIYKVNQIHKIYTCQLFQQKLQKNKIKQPSNTNIPYKQIDLIQDLCFELVLNNINCIKFDYQESYYEIYNEDIHILKKWQYYLEKILNQRGFHQQFKCYKKIGKGSFASVYLAERIQNNKLYAIKAFSKQIIFSQQYGKESIQNEIQVMRELNNAYSVQLHCVFETERSLYFVLDYLEGGQLQEKIDAKYKFSVFEIKNIMVKLLYAIKNMHYKKIMHRDLKPENILLKDNVSQLPIIADFGLATKYDLNEFLFVRCGTPGFVAPEVVNIKNLKTTYGPQCDIYQLGLIFYILLIGNSPFQGKTMDEILISNRDAYINFNINEILNLPLDTQDLLKCMLKKNPNERLTAENCLQHQFFKENIYIKVDVNEYNDQIKYLQKYEFIFKILLLRKDDNQEQYTFSQQKSQKQIQNLKNIEKDSCKTLLLGNSSKTYNEFESITRDENTCNRNNVYKQEQQKNIRSKQDIQNKDVDNIIYNNNYEGDLLFIQQFKILFLLISIYIKKEIINEKNNLMNDIQNEIII